MINITEKQDCTLIDSGGKEQCIPRGSLVPRFTNSEFILLKKSLGQTALSKPIFKVNRIQQVTSATDKNGSSLSLTTVEQFAKDVAKFFI